MSDQINQVVHLVVETGPDKDRKITVPDAGARIGRSSQNDIELTDPAISRFQCRVFFKPDGLLWIADLGSTNETLVNMKPVLESRLNVGDSIDIGESIIRVVCDNIKGIVTAPPPLPPQTAAPAHPAGFATPPTFAPFEKKEADAPPASSEKIDLGLIKDDKWGAQPGDAKQSGTKRWLWLVLVAMLAVAAVAMFKSGLLKPSGVVAQNAALDSTFAIYFEKVNGSTSNIFRYALTLEDGKLAVRIDSVAENRHVQREKKVAKDILDKLKNDIQGGGFFKLDESYQGLQPNAFNSADLEVAIGAQNRRSVVVNRVEPDEYKKVRETIEEFAKNELGLITISLSPEKLVSLAYDSVLQGQKLYGEREVKFGNLWDSIRSFEEAQIYLETIEPKPDFYPKVIDGLAACRTELDEQVKSFGFLADKAIRMQDWKTAADNLRIVQQLIPDRGDARNEDADKKLVDVERRIKR